VAAGNAATVELPDGDSPGDRGPDWRFLFPLEADSRVLLVGFAEEGFAESLAPDVAAVGAIVPAAPPAGSAPGNVVAAVTTADRIPFRDGTFDLIAADPDLLPAARDARLRHLRGLLAKLKPGGRLYLPAANRWGRLFPGARRYAPRGAAGAGALGMRGWRRLLERAGFAGIRFHAAFPDARRPRELVPLDDRVALDWWWRHVARVPRHGLPGAVARMTHGAGLTAQLVPHFAVVARRKLK
jgi:SAM-dependent methyltransferase